MKDSPISNGCPQLLGILGALLVLAPTIEARAGDPRVEAKADMVAGMSLLDQGDNDGALRKFEAAFALVPSPKVQFNMGLALQRLERNIQALEAFDRFLEGATDVPQEKRDQASRHRRELLSKVASITISAEIPGVEVAIDGVSRGTTPFTHPVYVEAGSHQLVARKAGWAPAPQNFAATKGAELTIPIALAARDRPTTVASAHPKPDPAPRPVLAPPAPNAPPVLVERPSTSLAPISSEPTPASSAGAWRRPAKWISLGLAAAGLGLGVVEGVIAVKKSYDFKANTQCRDDGKGHIAGGAACEQIDRAQSTATWREAIGFGIAGAFGATALILHLTEPTETAGTNSALVTCSPSASLTGAACVARW